MGWIFTTDPSESNTGLLGWYWFDQGDGPTPTSPRPTGGGVPSTPENYETYIPLAQIPESPNPKKSAGRKAALNSYMGWVKWKREEMQNLVKKYRAEFPQQIAAYEQSALGALPKATKEAWGTMYQNLDQRGLSDSSSFLGGAKKDLETWVTGEKSKIADTSQGMEAAAQQSILSAIGKPDYPTLYKNWIGADDQQAAYEFRKWQIENQAP